MKQINILKVLVFLLFSLPITVTAQNINFPDANFKAKLLKIRKIDTNNDGEISVTEAASYTDRLEVSSAKITDLTGIEYFTQITNFVCSNNNLTSLDVSHNTALKFLSCSYNQLESLDLSQNKELTNLDCQFNRKLTSLDLSQNKSLKYLKCCYNRKIKNLDVSNNTELYKLICHSCGLKKLDLTKNKELTILDCNYNPLEDLDLSRNTKLTSLNCSENKLNSLDISNNKALTDLNCSRNYLASLDISYNTALTKFNCSKNKFSFSSLLNIKSHYPGLTYEPNEFLYKSQRHEGILKVDYSSEATINGTQTIFSWHNYNDDNQVDNGIINDLGNGQFELLQRGKYYCQMTNEEFPGISLKAGLVTINGHVVTFKNWNNSELKQETVANNKPATAPEVPARNGYNFKGWDVDFNNVTSDLTVTTQYTPIEYTITYKPNGGTSTNPTSYSIERETLTLAEATKDGYTFAGWYDNAAFTGDAITKIATGSTGDIELWAKYTLAKYIITYNMDGGAATNSSSYSIESETIFLADATKDGYEFKGWYDNAAFTGDAITEIATGSTGDMELWANFTPVEYIITYNMNGGVATNPTSYSIESETITLSDATKNGYEFVGWYNNAAFTGDAITKIATGSKGDMELWAKYTLVEYTITYNLDGGTATNSASYSIESETIFLADATKDGYEFNGWYDNAAFTGDAITEIATGSTGDMELWANFTPVEYIITYNMNGGAATNPTSYSIESETITLSDATKNGYAFIGWYNNAAFTGDAITKIATGSTGDMELWAKYTLVEYTITYNLDGGTATNSSSYSIESETITLSDATKNGYAFIGWYNNAAFTGDAITKIATGSTGDMELWAKYTLVEYTITYNLDGGTATNSSSYSIESETISLADATKDGYAFIGWYDNATFTGDAITEITTGSIGNIELWAKFDKATATGQDINATSIKLYPNPADTYVSIESQGKGQVSIYSLGGNLVLSQTINQSTEQVDITHLLNGTYVVKIETPETSYTQKLIVK